MTAYNRIDDKTILNHEKYMVPDYVFILDPALVFTDDFTANEKESTQYIITTHLKKDELIALVPALAGREDRVFILDCFTIAQETIGRPIPNTPMLGAFMKISGMFDIHVFQDAMKSVLKKLPQKIIDANMVAIERAFNEVH